MKNITILTYALLLSGCVTAADQQFAANNEAQWDTFRTTLTMIPENRRAEVVAIAIRCGVQDGLLAEAGAGGVIPSDSPLLRTICQRPVQVAPRVTNIFQRFDTPDNGYTGPTVQPLPSAAFPDPVRQQQEHDAFCASVRTAPIYCR